MVTPMNSVTMVSALTMNRSPTLNAPQNLPHRDEQREGPDQRDAVVLPGLRVGRDAAGVVVTDHDDQAGADHGEQHAEPLRAGAALGGVVLADAAQRADDIAD